MPRQFPSRFVGAVAAVLLLLAACGSDDGASVTNLGDGTSSETGTASGTGSAPADEPAACVPVSPELEADATETVAIDATEFAFDPAEVRVAAGVTTFEVRNTGGLNHELAFLPGGGDVPFTDAGPDEDALADLGAFELEGFGSGLTCNATYDLEPGTYTLFCIIASDDGETHYEKGMKGTLTVS